MTTLISSQSFLDRLSPYLCIAMRILHTVIVCLVFMAHAWGQTQGSDYSYRLLNVNDGLCDNKIQSMVMDDRGFLWIGTAEGLSRFDGRNFRNYFSSRDSSRSFPSNYIKDIVAHKAGHICFLSSWCIWELNVENNTFHPTPFNRYDVYNLRTFPNGKLLITTKDSIYITDPNFNVLWTCASGTKPESYAYEAFPLDNDKFLLSNSFQHFIYYPSKNASKEYTFPIREVKGKSDDAHFRGFDPIRQTLYFSNWWTGLYEFDLSGNVVRHFNGILSSVDQLLINPKNRSFLVAAHGDAYIIDSSKGKVDVIHPSGNASGDSWKGNILFSYIDPQNNYWLGTALGIIKVYNNSNGVQVIRKNGRSPFHGDCMQIREANEESLLACFMQGGTYLIHKKTLETKVVDTSFMRNPWCGILHRDTIWVLGYTPTVSGNSLVTGFDMRSKSQIHKHRFQPFYGEADAATLAYKDRKGALWFSFNYGGGLIRQDPNTHRITQYQANSLPSSFQLGYAMFVAEDAQGHLWFSNNKTTKIVCLKDENSTFEVIDLGTPPERTSGGVFCLYADQDSTLWVGLESSGLAALNIYTKKLKFYTIEDGLSSATIENITGDSKGRLWLMTKKGLCCFIPSQQKFIPFGQVNNLPGMDLFSSGLYYDEETERLWMGNKNQIYVLDVNRLLAQASSVPSVYIDDIFINGKRVEQGRKITLSHDQNNIQFSFVAIDMENGSETEYAYQLIGADTNWISGGTTPSASYLGIHPGDYVFSVKARHKGNSKWTISQFPFSFTILPAWWQTWWFRLSITLLGLVLIFVVVRFIYTRKLAKEKAVMERQKAIQNERLRIATDLHDDFGASLSRIKFLSEKIRLQHAEQQELRESLKKISHYSDQVSEKMGEIVWALNERYDSVGDLFGFCRSYASEYMGDSYRLTYANDETINENAKIAGEQRRNVFLCFKEALHNIRKHADATEVRIHFSFLEKENAIRIKIKDNGKGMDANAIRPFANGLENMRQRMINIGGNIAFVNSNGLEVLIFAPCQL